MRPPQPTASAASPAMRAGGTLDNWRDNNTKLPSGFSCTGPAGQLLRSAEALPLGEKTGAILPRKHNGGCSPSRAEPNEHFWAEGWWKIAKKKRRGVSKKSLFLAYAAGRDRVSNVNYVQVTAKLYEWTVDSGRASWTTNLASIFKQLQGCITLFCWLLYCSTVVWFVVLWLNFLGWLLIFEGPMQANSLSTHTIY